jgi:hypothetical protein
MKKVKISIAALAFVLAIAGTATANANKAEADPCSKVDPKLQFCTGGTEEPCCEDGNVIYTFPPIR